MARASIITIGDELLIGQVIDTNSAWMAQQLNEVGIWMHQRIAVGDSREAIWSALDREAAGSEVILITGGLGPTADDITKPVLCEYFGGKLVVDEEALRNVKHIFERVLKRPIIERNLKQAEVPDNCRVIQNRRGTAPGMWFEKEGRIFVSMPGVPFEMKGMMTNEVLPELGRRFGLPPIAHRTLLLAGIGESFLAEHIQSFENALPEYIRLAYLPNFGMLRLRLTANGKDQQQIQATLDQQFGLLKGLVKEWLVTDRDISIEEAIGELLRSKQKTVSTAESCTGGNIAHLITSIPGSSDYFKGSVVSYANETKIDVLSVSPDTLAMHGAVSEETVREMAQGAQRLLKTDYAIATSGIMGPGGGSADKPAGTVWIAVADDHRVVARSFFFRFDRARNIELASTHALNLLRRFVLGLPD